MKCPKCKHVFTALRAPRGTCHRCVYSKRRVVRMVSVEPGGRKAPTCQECFVRVRRYHSSKPLAVLEAMWRSAALASGADLRRAVRAKTRAERKAGRAAGELAEQNAKLRAAEEHAYQAIIREDLARAVEKYPLFEFSDDGCGWSVKDARYPEIGEIFGTSPTTAATNMMIHIGGRP